MHASIPAMFSLFFLPLSFFLSLHSFYFQFLTTLLPWVVPLLVFPFLGSLSLGASLSVSASLRCLLLSYHGFLPLGATPLFIHGYLFLSQQTDSMRFLPFTPRASPTVFDLLWAFIQDCLLTHWLFDHYLCSKYVCCTITHFVIKFHFVCFCCIPLPLGSNG